MRTAPSCSALIALGYTFSTIVSSVAGVPSGSIGPAATGRNVSVHGCGVTTVLVSGFDAPTSASTASAPSPVSVVA